MRQTTARPYGSPRQNDCRRFPGHRGEARQVMATQYYRSAAWRPSPSGQARGGSSDSQVRPAGLCGRAKKAAGASAAWPTPPRTKAPSPAAWPTPPRTKAPSPAVSPAPPRRRPRRSHRGRAAAWSPASGRIRRRRPSARSARAPPAPARGRPRPRRGAPRPSG
jgi:hypothetical protein